MNSPEDDDNDNADREEESSSLMRPPPPKRVRIAENPGHVVGLVEPISDQERLESWYSSSEFSASKDSVKELCRSYRQSRRYSDCLTQAYNAACGLADRQESSSFIAVATTKASADDSVESKETELPDEVSGMAHREGWLAIYCSFDCSFFCHSRFFAKGARTMDARWFPRLGGL